MKNIKYNITMNTPVGFKHGSINVFTADNCIIGTLNLLEHTEPFSGLIDSEGNCKVSGKLITLMHTIEYTATGQITDNTIELLLQGDQKTFRITGTAAAESEVRN